MSPFSFYCHRNETPEWYTFRDPFLTDMSELIDLGTFLPILQKDEHKRQVIILRIAAHDPSRHSMNSVMKIGMMILDYLSMHDQTISVYGIRAIFDMNGIKLAHATQMTPKIIKHQVNAMECYPLRIQKMEFVNANRGINMILDIFRSFMTQKLRDRITVSRDIPKFNARDHLPVELGGTHGTYRDLAKHWKKVLQKNHQWFSENWKLYCFCDKNGRKKNFSIFFFYFTQLSFCFNFFQWVKMIKNNIYILLNGIIII